MTKDLVCSCVRRITPYSPGKFSKEVMEELGLTEVHKLASNENPLGPSPKAVEAMREALSEVHVYPDPVCRELTAALAEKLNVCGDGIVVGRGSDEIIHMLGLAFVRRAKQWARRGSGRGGRVRRPERARRLGGGELSHVDSGCQAPSPGPVSSTHLPLPTIYTV